jgi:nitroimidazol reductase NimA-like FMN-containing flavoprotein (pyridoxamine 5'-phosphate oxidase superfamily)
MSTVWDHEAEHNVAELSTDECWQLLRDSQYGRLGYHLAGEVNIVPINAVVDGERLVFRTGEGSKLLGIHMSEDVVYEVDAVDGGTATSVVARGRARVLSGTEEELADALHLTPWSPTWKSTFVEIEVTGVTGRRFRIRRTD